MQFLVLWHRRKDIFDIDLNCNNTNTSIPYIDVVCEILEQEVAPGPKYSFTGTVSVCTSEKFRTV